MPDILSKKESVTLKFRFEKINGSELNIATLIQDREVSKNAFRKFNFLSFSILDNRNNVPNITVIIEALIKEESNSSNIN